ncbi:hypothetical protein [Mesorhizobium sangaii]|uniref:Uncharacterized protein n=1 Tax=Mesorhizobium sangaii TaxID=505389 RepID=A0A841PGD9_9HYPH|nr:hypothetical protein [Mesorhizobium sangaii]MBB6409252.1 hypothetical protein [Mesorhizobium sangaii]
MEWITVSISPDWTRHDRAPSPKPAWQASMRSQGSLTTRQGARKADPDGLTSPGMVCRVSGSIRSFEQLAVTFAA